MEGEGDRGSCDVTPDLSHPNRWNWKKKVQNKIGKKKKQSAWHSLSDPSGPSERGDVQKTKVLCG